MDEIIAQVAQRTGLSADQARAAVEAVIEQLKTRLPAPLAAHLDGLVKGGAGAAGAAGATTSAGEAGGLGGLAGELGGLFGKK